jgi:DNA-binding XRE family transcriptional regulator/tetratricopeptide (TPR) repeat protein
VVNHKLRAARKAKAWTIETAAEKVGVSWVTYSRWEKGTQTPYLSTVRDICKAFHKSPQDLGLEHLVEESIEEETKHASLSSVSLQIDQNASAQNSPIVRLTSEQIAVLLSLLGDTTIMKTILKQFDPAKRETLRTLRELLAATGLALVGSQLADSEQWEHLDRLARALKKPSHIDTKTVTGLKNTTANYWQVRLSGSIASPDLLHATKEHYRIVTRLLQSSLLPTTRTSLSIVASETALLAGMLLATDMHKHDEAEAYYTEALGVAQQANNDALYAAVLGRMGALASAIGKPKEACSLLQEAQHALTRGDTFTLHAWLAAEEAEVQAGLAAQEHTQNTSLCFNALEKAETLADQIGPEENTCGMYFDLSRIPAYRGSCNLRLHQPDEALEALKEALEPLESSGALRRAVLLDLAETSIQATAIEQACEYVTQALEIIVQTQAISSLQRVYTLRGHLAPWSTMRDVKDLDEQLRALRP